MLEAALEWFAAMIAVSKENCKTIVDVVWWDEKKSDCAKSPAQIRFTR